jgi:hypothetical protein
MPVNVPTESTVTVSEESLTDAYREYRSLGPDGTLSSESFAVVNKALKQLGGSDGPGIVEIRPGEEGKDLYGLTTGGDNPFAPFLQRSTSSTDPPTRETSAPDPPTRETSAPDPPTRETSAPEPSTTPTSGSSGGVASPPSPPSIDADDAGDVAASVPGLGPSSGYVEDAIASPIGAVFAVIVAVAVAVGWS